jgi:hypothetical protein
MALLLDGKDYDGWKRMLAYILLVGMAFFILSSGLALHIMGAPGAESLPLVCGSPLAICLIFALILKQRGLAFSKPIKIYDDSIEIQPSMGFSTVNVPFTEIKSITLVSSKYGSCAIETISNAYYSSTEIFGKDSLKKIIAVLGPALKRYSIAETSRTETARMSVTFERI